MLWHVLLKVCKAKFMDYASNGRPTWLIPLISERNYGMPYCFAETICLTLLPLLTVPFEDVSVMCDRRDSSYVPHSLVRKDLPFSYVVRSYVSFFILVEVMPLSSRYKSYCHVNKHTLYLPLFCIWTFHCFYCWKVSQACSCKGFLYFSLFS